MCADSDIVIEIYFRNNGQGNGVALCKKCADELVGGIKFFYDNYRNDEEIDDGDWTTQ